MRLDKLVGLNGYTRKQAKAMIAAGRVHIGGRATRDAGALIECGRTPITIDGAPARMGEHLHLMLNKPAGYITATRDAHAPAALDLIDVAYRRAELGPVGRLDKDVTGLVLFTTDGQLAHRLIAPRFEQEKVYEALVEGAVGEEAAARFRAGMALSDFTARPAGLTVLERGARSLCRVTLTEGHYHQVKRMFAAAGHPVLALKRLSIAGVALDESLAPGAWRELTPDEAGRLYRGVGMDG